ncbi:hypothetical protein [Photobacterium sp. GB-36]|uniref:hypothetical protein n=1 Tax=Photobacterium sp. GB-36 TaxID=2022108 RepID=UPI000D1726FE|nr:hypothetical protein [Photobacterium sp. GB-36]PSV47142.1 hypothetical protein C9J46_02580 [Photobacterium sp. GB-36]
MTKLFSLSAIALLTGLSTAASAASLDVHGEIKINGKTVIDDKGNLIQDQSDLINIDDYTNATPNRVVTLVAPNLENGYTRTYKFYYDETGRQSKEELLVNSKIMWLTEWTDRTTTPLANKKTTISYSYENGTTSEFKVVSKNVFSTSSGYPLAKMGIDMSRADIYTSTILESTDQEAIGQVTQATEYDTLSVIDKVSVKMENTVIEDCIVVRQGGSWMTQGDQIRTYCKDYGLVQFDDFKVQSAE